MSPAQKPACGRASPRGAKFKRYSGPLMGAVMRRRAGQCWGLCSARCASHRPQQGRRCPFGRHARPPPGQAVQHARRSVPPSPPLLSNGGRVAAGTPRQHCGRAGATTPAGSKSGHPAKRDAASGRECQTRGNLSSRKGYDRIPRPRHGPDRGMKFPSPHGDTAHRKKRGPQVWASSSCHDSRSGWRGSRAATTQAVKPQGSKLQPRCCNIFSSGKRPLFLAIRKAFVIDSIINTFRHTKKPAGLASLPKKNQIHQGVTSKSDRA